MANVSRINGFVPTKHLNGSPYNGQFNFYEIVAGDGTTTNIGDVVKADTGVGTEGYTTCIRFGATSEQTSGVPLGVVVGFKVDPTALNYPQYRAASTKRIAMVADSPDLLFEVQDGGTVPCTQTLIGNNTGINTPVGSTTSSVSTMTSGATVPNTTNTLPLRIMGIKRAPDVNDGSQTVAASQKLIVMFNAHQFNGVGTTGV
jgi:hypothetical protein